MNECIFHQALSISLAGLPHCYDLFGQHLACHFGFVVRGKGATRSPQNIPRCVECRRQCLGRFGIERCGLKKCSYRHRRARQRLHRGRQLAGNNYTRMKKRWRLYFVCRLATAKNIIFRILTIKTHV